MRPKSISAPTASGCMAPRIRSGSTFPSPTENCTQDSSRGTKLHLECNVEGFNSPFPTLSKLLYLTTTSQLFFLVHTVPAMPTCFSPTDVPFITSSEAAMFTELPVPDVRSGCSFSCNGCSFLTVGMLEMVEHVRGFHAPQEHQCPYCKRIYTSKSSIKSHISRHHRELHASSSGQKLPW
jgi:hypothetical protein